MYKIKEVKQNPCDVGFEMELLGRIPELFFFSFFAYFLALSRKNLEAMATAFMSTLDTQMVI